MKITRLSFKELNEKIKQYNLEFSKKDILEVKQENDVRVIFINQQPMFFYHQEKVVPTLHYLQHHSLLKKITIDMGAVKFIVNGADVMRPGIVEIEDTINKDEFIVKIDNNHKKPLAVGIALYNSEEMQSLKTGKVIKNIHYVGDEIWKIS